jgi:hypothetical protein
MFPSFDAQRPRHVGDDLGIRHARPEIARTIEAAPGGDHVPDIPAGCQLLGFGVTASIIHDMEESMTATAPSPCRPTTSPPAAGARPAPYDAAGLV